MVSKQKILIVDDDNNIAELIALYLTKECFETKIVNDGEEALREFASFRPDLIILDLMLPGIDGYQVCREIRHTSDVPIIMLSAKGETFDKVLGLELGADDYMIKPFDSKELVARVRAVLRRFQVKQPAPSSSEKCVTYPDLTVNLTNYAVTYMGRQVDMPPKELELLYFLAASPNQVFTREQLLDHIWGYEYIGDTRTVDVHIKRLREKIKDNPHWSIATVWGIGYKFEVKKSMKQHHLSTKFLRFYILIGILGFFLITLGGSYMVEKHLEHSLSAALYTEAHNIASNEAVKSNISSSTVDTLQEHLCAISDFQDAVLWIINSNGEIIVSTQKNIDVRDPIPLEEFDASKWGSNYYQIGKFYGFFKTDHLSVIAPITSDMETKGYVAIHYSMTNLYQSRSSILFIMQVIFLLCYAATSLLLWAYSHYIRKPLARIMKGASEYAGGNLAYKIDVTSDDEMGYLAKTLNYMSDELNKNGEYQRKFIANVSHDFRSPLTSIKGYVNAILDGTIPYEMQERYLKIIAFESERLEKLTRSLLTLNELDMKKRMMHIQRFDINDTIKNTAATFEGICTSRQIRLELLLSGHELYVRADMEQIQQVLYNLLDNAIKFSNDNSSVQIETTVKSGKVFVSVKDYGTGIPKESLGKIWDRFYKIDASRGKDRKGTGLGLSIVKEIINAHNQNIDVISTEGVGTEFIFTLEKTK